MAVPTMTNNSPSAGYIAWGAFTIQLYGVAYSISAGSTNQRWVWWEYKNGAPIINAGPEVPTTLVDDDLVLFANKNGIGVRVQSTSFVDGELLVDGSIFADALSTNLIETKHIIALGLDAGVIKFGLMSGDRIAANTITAEKLTVGSLGNSMISNGSFEDDVYWIGSASATRVAASAHSGDWGMRLTASGGIGLSTPEFPVGAGSLIAVTGWAKGVVAATGLYFRISWRNAAGTEIGTADAVSNTAVAVGAYVQLGSAVTAPALTTGAVLQVYNTAGTVDIDDLEVNPVIISAQIGDGQILAPKIKAGELNSAHITTTGLDAGVIKFGEMNGARITVGTMNADRIVSNTLQAAIVNAGAINGITITGSTLVGVLQTSASANRVVVRDLSSSGYVEFWSGIANESSNDIGRVYTGIVASGQPNKQPYMTIESPRPANRAKASITLKSSSEDGTIPESIALSAVGGVTVLDSKTPYYSERIAHPIGTVIMHAGDPGDTTDLWLKCDGREVSRTTFVDLWLILGTTSSPWGQGNGSTTFNLPNLTNRFPRGSAVGVAGGSDTVTMLDHTHFSGTLATATEPGHAHGLGAGTTASNTTTTGSAVRLTGAGNTGTAGSHSHGVTGQSGVVVSNPATSNLPGYMGLGFFIKAR